MPKPGPSGMLAAPTLTVSCTNPDCPDPAQRAVVHLQAAGPGVYAHPPLHCMACGDQVRENAPGEA